MVNSVIKPAAGVVGLISQPIEGSAVSARALLVKPAKERHATRYAEGMAAFLGSSETEREAVIQAFEVRKATWKGKRAI